MTELLAINNPHQDTFWYVLPKSDFLEGPALFSKWQDCCKHSSSSSSESEYHSFRVLKDAIEYLQAAVTEQDKVTQNKDSQEQQANLPPRDHPQQTAASSRSALRVQENPSVPSPTCPSPSSETNKNHSPSKKRRRADDVAPPAPNQAQRIPPEISPHPLPPQIGMNRPSRAMSPSTPHLSQPPSIPPPSSSRRQGALVDDSQTRRTRTSSATTREGMPDKRFKAEKRQLFDCVFEPNFVRLKEFKQEYGDTDVPFRQGVYRIGDKTIDWNKYNGLGKWCSETRSQLKFFQASEDTSHLSSVRAAQLRQLGFCMDPIRHLSTLPVWKEKYYQQLQAFHREHGHSKVPSKPSTGFVAWIYKIQEAYQRILQGSRPP
jgi:hypothetical protein